MGCAALSGFFALNGFALRSFRRVQLESAFGAASRKDARRKAGHGRLASFERSLNSLQLTIPLCRTLANLGLVVGMFYLMGVSSLEAGSWPRAVEAVGISIAIIAIFGVAIPHAWAAYSGEKVLAAMYYPLMVLRYLFLPVTAVMNVFDLPIRRLSGNAGDGRETEHESAKLEIMQAATEGHAEGAVSAEEVRMIESVIKFGRRQVGEIMTPRTEIAAMPVQTGWSQAATLAHGIGHTRIPVYDGDIDNIIGILYVKDLLQHGGSDGPGDMRTIIRKPLFVPESKKLGDLLREFKARKLHLAVVLDEYGGTAGLITFEDILEEIVGEIADEYDSHEPALLHRLDDRTVEIDGRMPIQDLNDAFGISLPRDESYDTLAGFVFSELGYIPTSGESLRTANVQITVLAADARRITKLKVQKLAEQAES